MIPSILQLSKKVKKGVNKNKGPRGPGFKGARGQAKRTPPLTLARAQVGKQKSPIKGA